jgi:hypothetical protein
MQLNKMDVICALNQCTVTVRVVFYGDDPSVLYSPKNPGDTQGYKAADATCTGALQSTQYCATAEFSTTVILQGT